MEVPDTQRTGWGPVAVVRCTACGLGFVPEIYSAAEVQAIYAPCGDDYYDLLDRGRMDQTFLLFQRLIPDIEGLELLDVGAGDGHFCRLAQDAGAQVVGVEPSQASVAAGRRMWGVDLVCSTFDDFAASRPDASVDVITAWEVVEHLVDLRGFYYHVARLVRPGGAFVLSTPNQERLLRRLARLNAHLHGRKYDPGYNRRHLQYLGRRLLKAAGEREGLMLYHTLYADLDDWLHASSEPVVPWSQALDVQPTMGVVERMARAVLGRLIRGQRNIVAQYVHESPAGGLAPNQGPTGRGDRPCGPGPLMAAPSVSHSWGTMPCNAPNSGLTLPATGNAAPPEGRGRRIAHWSFSFTPELAGLSRYIENLARHLPEYRFVIVTERLRGLAVREQITGNIEVRRFGPLDRVRSDGPKPGWKVLLPYAATCDVVRTTRQRRYFARGGFDIIHVHDVAIALLGLALKLRWSPLERLRQRLLNLRRAGPPLVFTKHFQFSAALPRGPFLDSAFRALTAFDDVICLSDASTAEVHDWFSGSPPFRVWQIPTAVDTDTFAFRPLASSGPLRVGFAGRLEQAKGEHLLAQLLDQWPTGIELHLAVCMSAERVPRLLGGRRPLPVTVRTDIPGDDMPGFYHSVDILLNLTTEPRADQTILEAMACGRPVVRLDVGEPAPVVHGENGFVVASDAGAILSCLQSIVGARARLPEMGLRARQAIEGGYGARQTARRISNVYEAALESHPKASLPMERAAV